MFLYSERSDALKLISLTQPIFCMWIAKSSLIGVPGKIEVDRAIVSSLDHSPAMRRVKLTASAESLKLTC